MSLKENSKHVLGSSNDSIFQVESFLSTRDKKLLKILLISENSTDVYMINKLLSKNDGYMIHEASTLSGALKVMNYLNLDLILVDDMLSNLDGYEVIEKLNHMEVIKEIPKILLLTEDYRKEKKESFIFENLDFVKKPLDSVIFKLRVKSLIAQNAQKMDRRSYFKRLAQQKFEEASQHMSLYQEIFETSESIMCIYDTKKDQIVESNAMFEKFFLNLESFNRIISNSKVVRRFVPYIDEANYLNYYDPKKWMSTLVEGKGFTYLVKLQRDFKEYSFNIFIKKVSSAEGELYLIRLSNIYDYLPQKHLDKPNSKLQLKEKNLEVFKNDFLQLRETLWHQHIDNEEVEKLMYQLGIKLSIVCDDSSIVEMMSKRKESNIYFTVVQLIKEKFLHKNIYVNGKEVDKLLEENGESLLASINTNAIHDLIFSLLNNYYGSSFNSKSEYQRLDILLYIKNDLLTIEIRVEKVNNSNSNESFFDKLFNKNEEMLEESIVDNLPKIAKKSLSLLRADIQKIEEQSESIFLINMPLLK